MIDGNEFAVKFLYELVILVNLLYNDVLAYAFALLYDSDNITEIE